MPYEPPVIGPEDVFLHELLVTDTMAWEVIKRTPKTMTLRRAGGGKTILSRKIDGNVYPVTYDEVTSNPNGHVIVVKLRKDGTFRTGQGANPLRPCHRIDGVPVTKTDYRE